LIEQQLVKDAPVAWRKRTTAGFGRTDMVQGVKTYFTMGLLTDELWPEQ
jgi:hypothetical protein